MTLDLQTTEVAIGPARLEGDLHLPREARGLVIFAHGNGSSRFSPRNNFVARKLVEYGFATLLFDLLDDEEAEDRRNVFDIALLGERVCDAIDWAAQAREVRDLQIGLFGASTGAAAALVAAAQEPTRVSAVVSRGVKRWKMPCASSIVTFARPNSRLSAFSTLPPSWCAKSCMP